jgi:PKD repeat protein
VYPLPVVNAGADITLCDQPIPFTLTGFSPTGGTWSGSTLVTSAGVFTPNGTGTFTLTYTYTDPSTGCVNTDDLVVTVANPQLADAGPDFSICQNAPSVQLAGFSPSGGTWSGSTMVSSSGLFTPNTVGSFTLTYTYGTGTCLSTDDLVVTVNQLPTPSVNSPTICINQQTTLTANGGVSYLWNTGDATASITVTPTITTSYTVTATNQYGCTDSIIGTVTVNPLPTVIAGPDVSLCDQPIPYTLTGFSPVGGSWSGSTQVTSSGVFTPNGVGTITLTYTFTDPQTGCINSDDLVVTVASPQLADAGADFSICQNAPSIQLAGFSPIGGSWSGSPWVTSSGVFTPSVVGTYTLTYTYGTGTCLSTDDLVVTVNPLPSPTVNNAVICLNQPAILTVNGGLSYLWSTGDIATSITVSPSITTSYTVTATNQFGCEDSVTGTVTVNPLPVVDAGNDTTYCFQGINVQLPSYATPANGTWFGTGVLNASGSFDPSIPGIGPHYVYYTFTDANNCTDYDSILVNIVLPSVAEAGPGNVVCIDNGVFSLGGFSPSTGGSWSGPGIVNAAAGLFDPTISGVGTFLLYYEFGVGSCYTKDSTIVIVNPLPNVNAGSDIDTCISVPPFSLTGFSPLSGGSWSGSGVTPSGLFSPALAGVGSHTLIYEYQEPSTSCVNRDSITVLVNPLPVPGFTVGSVLCLNTPFTITNNTTGATSYLWNFGDGNNSSLFNPTHTYIQTGTYTISLIATSASACVDSISFNVQVVVPPTVAFSLSTDDGCGPLLVDITNNSVSFNPSYLWDFGNGTTGTMIDPLPISYPAGVIGDTTYYITLSTTNLCGSAIVVDSILVRPSPTAYFGIDFSTGCSPLTVNFANVSYGLPTSYFWDFGDGTTSTDSLPLPHTYFAYTNDTTYYITLIVTNPCGSDTLVDSVTVSPNTVNAFINATPQSGCQPLTVTFTNFSTGGSNYYWDFGDGNTSIGYSVTHTYQNPGTYTASFQIDNGCSFDTVYRNITVYPKPVIDFIAVPDTVCIGDIVQFTNSSTQALTATLWNFGDGSTSTLAQPQHAYAAPGTYNVTLIGIASQSCSDTVIKTVVVRTPPLVSAGFDTVYCNSNTIVNLSTPSPSGGIWLGNGILNPNTGTFNPSFVGVGTFQVFYSYTDVFGCSNSDTALVTVNLPDTVLVGSDTSVCINSNPFLLNGLPAGGSWSGTLVQPNGLVTPSTDGNYTLTYTYGVGSCLVRDSLILTVNPLPVLSVSGNPTSLCVNDPTVSLLATPLGGVWNGPGLTGNVFDPSVTGAAQVNLVYTFADNNGCVNSASLPIAVNGLPVVTIANDTSYCLQPIPAQLPFASPPGGIWSGTGVTSQTLGTFFPPNAGLGVHQIYYSYTDGNNCTNVDTILVTINPPANVDAGPDTAVCHNTAAFVLVGSPLGGTWSGPFVQPGGNFVPSSVGTHQLIYTFGQGTCERKDTLYVTVHPLPPINLAGNIVTHCVNDPAVSLVASPLGGIWSGPGVVGTFFNPSIAGIGSPFVLSYSFVDSNSCVNTALLNMSVLPLPSVNAGNDTTVCDQNIAVSLYGNYGNAGTWTGAGVTANGIFNPQGIGTYPLVYTYTDPNGCTDSDTMVVTVIPPTFAEAGPGLTLCVDAGNVTMPSFTPGTGGIWYYPFGPGVVDAAAGIINPSLLMQGSTVQTSFVLYYQYGFGNCLTTDSTIVVVNPLPVVNAGADTSSCITASPFNLFGFTPNGGVWSGIGVVDSLAGLFDPWLANAGTYQITYTYTDPTTGCQNADYRDVTVHPQPVADYDSSLFEGCQPLPVNFINQTTGATGYVWDFGDGNVSTLSNPLHIYADSGQFNVTLYTESSFGCRDTAYGTVVVHPKPVADFTYTPAFSCVSPVNVQMQNLSTDPTGSLWDFGAQGTSTFIDPSITYAQPGSYPIQLISTSAFGCKDTMVKNYEVYPTPEAIPLIADPTACVGEPVPFTHASLNGVYYQWQFGDGDSTDIASPIHIYSAPGVYSIQLVVVGAGGCSDTAIVQNAISVLNTPVASFNYIKDPDPYNYGLVHFTNGSSGGTTYNWDFGDGNTSPLVNPSHQYQNYGEYIVTLIVTNANGCADTATQIIYVDYFKGLFVPNALTPEDGPEDVRHFLPKGRGLKRYRLEIFDSWGNLLWYSDKLEDGIPVEGWKGTRMDNGVLLPQDVYVWKIRAEFLDGSLWEGQDRGDGRKRNTGTITLIR